MKVSVCQGVAATATLYQLEQLLFIVDHIGTYRDWDWLDGWLRGSGRQEWTPDKVVKLYSDEEYWAAVTAGDIMKVNYIRDALLGTV
jgi:hypothetical protein